MPLYGTADQNNFEQSASVVMKFRVPFPLFVDPQFDIHKKFGEPGAPYTILASSSGKVLYTYYGEVKDIDDFLSLIRKFHKQQ